MPGPIGGPGTGLTSSPRAIRGRSRPRAAGASGGPLRGSRPAAGREWSASGAPNRPRALRGASRRSAGGELDRAVVGPVVLRDVGGAGKGKVRSAGANTVRHEPLHRPGGREGGDADAVLHDLGWLSEPVRPGRERDVHHVLELSDLDRQDVRDQHGASGSLLEGLAHGRARFHDQLGGAVGVEHALQRHVEGQVRVPDRLHGSLPHGRHGRARNTNLLQAPGTVGQLQHGLERVPVGPLRARVRDDVGSDLGGEGGGMSVERGRATRPRGRVAGRSIPASCPGRVRIGPQA